MIAKAISIGFAKPTCFCPFFFKQRMSGQEAFLVMEPKLTKLQENNARKRSQESSQTNSLVKLTLNSFIITVIIELIFFI